MKGNPRDSGYEKAADSWYQESRKAIDLLLDAETFAGPVWDPACGEGNIPKACVAHGLTAHGSDLANRGYGTPSVDFLKTVGRFQGDVVTNPPFDLWEPFVHHALKTATGKVAAIGRLALLEGLGRRESLWTTTCFSHCWVFSGRQSMPPGGQGIKPSGGAVAYAWFVWDHAHPIGKPADIGFLA